MSRLFMALADVNSGTPGINVPNYPDTVEPDTFISPVFLSDLNDAVLSVFNMASKGFTFIASNPLCMLMVALSFAGAGLGLVGRAFKTSRR